MFDTAQAFWSKIEVADNGCWLWTASRNDAGYGQCAVETRSRLAHRVSYKVFVGPIPDGLVLDHICHNADPTCPAGPSCLHRRCVNPEHLEPVTRAENARRGQCGKWQAQQTHCIHGHEFTTGNTIVDDLNHRQCRICTTARARAAYARRKARYGRFWMADRVSA